MIVQHVSAWLWNAPALNLPDLFREYPVIMGFNWLGNMAAPVFIILAGTGSVNIYGRKKNASLTLIKRGGVLIIFGYVLNLIAPLWFSPGSWFVLHLIGLCLIISPLLNRMQSYILVVIAILFLIAAAFIQSQLDTPLILTEHRMNNFYMPGGAFRLALAEGHFPVFPWLSVFIMGIVAGRWIKAGALRRIQLISIISTASACILAALYFKGYAFATYGSFYRIFVPLPYFFPALPPFMLFLTGLALLFAAFAVIIEKQRTISNSMFLTAMGRTSITMLVLHTLIFNDLSRLVGIYMKCSQLLTCVIVSIFIIICAFIAVLWQHKKYIYGFEWVLRKIAG